MTHAHVETMSITELMHHMIDNHINTDFRPHQTLGSKIRMLLESVIPATMPAQDVATLFMHTEMKAHLSYNLSNEDAWLTFEEVVNEIIAQRAMLLDSVIPETMSAQDSEHAAKIATKKKALFKRVYITLGITTAVVGGLLVAGHLMTREA